MAASQTSTWLRFLPIGVYHIRQSVSFALRRLLSSFTKSVHSKSYRAPKICDLSSSLRFSLSFPVLIVTCAVCSFRALIYKHIGSLGIQNCVEFPLPVSLKLHVSSPFLSVFLTPSLSHGHGLLTLCVCDGFCVLSGVLVCEMCACSSMIVCFLRSDTIYKMRPHALRL